MAYMYCLIAALEQNFKSAHKGKGQGHLKVVCCQSPFKWTHTYRDQDMTP